MDDFVVVLAWQVADLHAAAALKPLPAASQHVGFTVTTDSQFGSSRLLRFPSLTPYDE